MPSHTLATIQLPSDLIWVNEFSWTPVVKSVSRSLSGAQLVQTAVKAQGRPITLSGQHAWISRADVIALRALADAPDVTYTLTLADTRVFTVMFDDNGFSADPVYQIDLPDAAHPYSIQIKLLTV
jgi:hypothetical protein